MFQFILESSGCLLLISSHFLPVLITLCKQWSQTAQLPEGASFRRHTCAPLHLIDRTDLEFKGSNLSDHQAEWKSLLFLKVSGAVQIYSVDFQKQHVTWEDTEGDFEDN